MKIKKIIDKDKAWLKKVSLEEYGGEFCVFLGRKFYIEDLEGFYLEDESKKLGLITYEIRDNLCEIMTFNAFSKFQGTGTKLLKKVIQETKNKKLNKIIVRTTNDNLDALRFYQRRNFKIVRIYKNIIDRDRTLKPAIPKIGDYKIPMQDAIELEFLL